MALGRPLRSRRAGLNLAPKSGSRKKTRP
jgi:hypothetical protein